MCVCVCACVCACVRACVCVAEPHKVFNGDNAEDSRDISAHACTRNVLHFTLFPLTIDLHVHDGTCTMWIIVY